MKKVVGVFAHPDDEAFGPSGTIALLAKEHEVYLICATNGDAASGAPDIALGKIRKQELRESAKILGVKEVFFLEFKDGSLCNNLYFDLANKIEEILNKLKPSLVLTIDPRGISGHIDHIAISMVTSFVYQKLEFIKEIWYNCISEEFRNQTPSYFIYFPQGYKKSEIDKIIDISSVFEQKISAMKAHKSQYKDAEFLISRNAILPKEEYFLVKKK